YFKYMLVPEVSSSAEEYIPVATTRPETILGDTAVAVHPEDERYRHFIGRKAIVPILGRQIPVIGDTYVDREFGTGALKITPGHDPNDYEIGLRHGLEIISVLDEAARINEHGGPYAGQDRFEARKNIWRDMQALGLAIKEEPYLMSIPRSQRGNEIIEPMISTQWFVKIQPLAEAALKVVQEGRIRIIPERFTKIYINWLENIEDWCISRQLWWGHRIPVWYCADCGELTVSRTDPTHCQHCHSPNIEQDPDVLDTWFSSALWPFSTLGWPDETPDYRYFYPTSVMETGYDILFFWVARMIMTALEFTGQIPFHTVYLHGLIRDEHGRKMSKTLGNIIDPLTVMDEYGTDALRFTLLVGSTPGNDTNLSIKKVEANRNFANKVWNIGRFIIQSLAQVPSAPLAPPQWTLADSWIWARLQGVIRDVERLFQSYQFGEAGRLIYDFLWSEFADWYVEIAKIQLQKGGDRAFYTAQTLVWVFDQCLRMLHPFTPFVTEATWGYLKEAAQKCSPLLSPKQGWEEALIVAKWPELRNPEGWEDEKIAQFNLVQEIVRGIRNARSENNVPIAQPIGATFVSSAYLPLLREQLEVIAKLARLDLARLTVTDSLAAKPHGKLPLVVKEVEIYLDLEALIDPEKECQRLQAELGEVNQHIERLRQLLESPFSQKAPASIVEKERQKLADLEVAADKLKKQLRELGVEV
ncbi:MAG: valine--tRNA ligase, partial [Anaerolineales bacterium]|nr:valine--tRNA ligase [Anaerolineales bacterium]MDW8447548.1 valine--tRNA ligase [Anaerolineales bacterium]